MTSKKIFQYIVLALIIALAASLNVSALKNKAAYIHHNMRTLDQNRVAEIESMGFQVDVIKDTNITAYNLSNYDFILVNDNFLANPEAIPVHQYPMIVMNYNYLDVWHIAKTSYVITSSKPLVGVVLDPLSSITKNVPATFNIYTSCCSGPTNLPAYYLGRQFEVAPGVKKVVGSANVIFDHEIIGTFSPGAQLRDGKIANAKTVFFGIKETDFWTSDSRKLFRQSIEWLTLDDTAPVLTNLSIKTYYNEANVSFLTDDEAKATIKYGLSATSLNEVMSNVSLNRTHFFQITGLSAVKTYFMNITVCNKENVCATNGPYSFTTDPSPIPDSPLNMTIEVLVPSNNIRLKWTTPTSQPPVNHYNIYIADTPDSFNFNFPYDAVTMPEFVDMFAPLHSQRYYIVRAVDTNGVEEQNMYITGKYDLMLKRGENFVSFPLKLLANNITTVMHQTSGYQPVTIVQRLKASSPNLYDKASFNGIAWSGQFNTIENSKGYIFNASQDATFTTVGELPHGPYTIQLNAGMNLVGFTTVHEQPINTMLQQQPASYIVSELSQKEGQRFDIATYYPDAGQFYSVEGLTTIQPGVGYWLKAKTSGSLQYQ